MSGYRPKILSKTGQNTRSLPSSSRLHLSLPSFSLSLISLAFLYFSLPHSYICLNLSLDSPLSSPPFERTHTRPRTIHAHSVHNHTHILHPLFFHPSFHYNPNTIRLFKRNKTHVSILFLITTREPPIS